MRSLLEFEAARAWNYYREGVELIPRVHADARAALWALARIYSGLLRRIEARGYDVFSERVRLSTPEKDGNPAARAAGLVLPTQCPRRA